MGSTKVKALDSSERKLNDLLRQVGGPPNLASHPELVFEIEKLGRKFLRDEGREQAAAHFEMVVEQARKFLQAQSDPGLELQFYLSAGQSYALLGFLDKARSMYEQAVHRSAAFNNLLLQARALRLLGNLSLQQNLVGQAIPLFKQSQTLCEENGELLEAAYALNSLSAAYFQTAAWPKMQRACDEALAIAEKLNEDELVASVYNNLGAMYSMRGQMSKALAAFQKSVPIFEKLADHRGLAEGYNNMAIVYRDKDLWQEAGKYFAHSLHFSSIAGDALIKTGTILNRVELYILMHDLQLARQQALEALATFHQLGSKFGQADACKHLGVIYTKQEYWELARKYFDEALELCTESNYTLGFAETHWRYADFHVARSEEEAALHHLQLSLTNYRLIKAFHKARRVKKQLKLIQATAGDGTH